MVVTGRRRAVSALVSASGVCVWLYFQFWVFSCAAVGRFASFQDAQDFRGIPLPGCCCGPVKPVCPLVSEGCGLHDQLGKVPGKTVPGGNGGPVVTNKLRRFARLFPGRCRGIRSQNRTPAPAAGAAVVSTKNRGLRASKLRDGRRLPAACHPGRDPILRRSAPAPTNKRSSISPEFFSDAKQVCSA